MTHFFCITVLQILFSIDISSLFLPPVMCCTYTYELSAKKNYQIWCGSFPVRCHSDIRRSSDRWNNILEEMSRARGSSARISGNTLRPALAGLWLLLFQDNQVPFFVLFGEFVKIYRYIYSGFQKGNTIVSKRSKILGLSYLL